MAALKRQARRKKWGHFAKTNAGCILARFGNVALRAAKGPPIPRVNRVTIFFTGGAADGTGPIHPQTAIGRPEDARTG